MIIVSKFSKYLETSRCDPSWPHKNIQREVEPIFLPWRTLSPLAEDVMFARLSMGAELHQCCMEVTKKCCWGDAIPKCGGFKYFFHPKDGNDPMWVFFSKGLKPQTVSIFVEPMVGSWGLCVCLGVPLSGSISPVVIFSFKKEIR